MVVAWVMGRRQLIWACLLVGAGCSGASEQGIGAAGGTVTAAGVTLAIPRSALSTAQVIRVTPLDTTVEGYRMSSRLFRFEPEGMTFATPAAVAFDCTIDCAEAAVYWSRPDRLGYERLDTRYIDGALRAAVTHFSTGFGGAPAAADDLGATDLAIAVDSGPSPDLLPDVDLAVGSDLAVMADLSVTVDQASSPDLAMAGDLAVGSCRDGVQDGTETAIDCGGLTCFPCGDGRACLVDDDCVSFTCSTDHLCIEPPSCIDGVQNQDETAPDCGGLLCGACADGKTCLVARDCISGSGPTDTHLCGPTSLDGGAVWPCQDGVENYLETDIDCGGSDCAKCPNGKHCIQDRDCQSGWCDTRSSTCAPITCVPPFFIQGATAPSGIVDLTADFDLDGKLDLVVATPSTFGIALGQGDGTFAAPARYSAMTTGAQFQVADWDGNSAPDLLLTWSDHAQALVGAGDGTFKRGPSVPLTVDSSWGVLSSWISANVDGDAKGDILAFGEFGYVDYAGNGDGSFGTGSLVSYDGSGNVVTAYAVRARGLGKTDWAVSLRGIGGHGVQSSRLGYINLAIYFVHPDRLYPSDFDGDGLDDLAIAFESTVTVWHAGSPGQISGVLAHKSGQSPVEITAYGTLVAAGDFNGDGKADLLTSAGLMCGNGDATFQAVIPVSAAIDPRIQGDFNNDGRNDYIDTNGEIHLNAN
jgi:hypothetical protein